MSSEAEQRMRKTNKKVNEESSKKTSQEEEESYYEKSKSGAPPTNPTPRGTGVGAGAGANATPDSKASINTFDLQQLVEVSKSMHEFTLISTFNLSKLLSSDAFRNALASVAESAEREAHRKRQQIVDEMSKKVDEMTNEVEELKKTLERVVKSSRSAMESTKKRLEEEKEGSSERFKKEMTSLSDAVMKLTMKAAFAQVREMRMHTEVQEEMYEKYWHGETVKTGISSPPPPYP